MKKKNGDLCKYYGNKTLNAMKIIAKIANELAQYALLISFKIAH